jgi:hypothetical protein
VAGLKRLDLARISTGSAVVEMPWESRFELLERVRGLAGGGAEVARRFEAAGATRPVELDPAAKMLLLNVLSHWAAAMGVDELPPGIPELGNALADDLWR